MADYIPKEKLQAYTRWRADDFTRKSVPPDAPPAASSGQASTEGSEAVVNLHEIPLPTAESIERIHEEARNSGYQAGYEEGQKAGHAEGYQTGMASAQSCVEQLLALNQGLQEALSHLDQEIAESLLACALEVARQVIRSTIQIKPEILLPIIREALAALPLQHGPVTLRVHPDDLPLVREHLGASFNQSDWRIQEDGGIAPGGCRLEAGSSEIDATLPTRWRRALEAIGTTPEWLDTRP
jgi:flagellar assembly protein FliH